jgi:hypothetical protein
LENISGTFNNAPPQNLAESSYLSKSSPLRKSAGTQGMDSEGMYSNSTNNLEKAYENLEKEITEIKARLQSSVGSAVANERLHASLRNP